MMTLPEPTPYDLKFRILGIPIRVHPGFWIVMAVIGGAGNRLVASFLIFIGCALVSLLVHELGHATTMKAFGQWPRGGGPGAHIRGLDTGCLIDRFPTRPPCRPGRP